MIKSIIFSISILFSLPVLAADEVELEGTSIIGNRELPKVLYIAPWKKPHMTELGRPVNSLINDTLAPIERDVMTRTIRYHDQLVERQEQIEKE